MDGWIDSRKEMECIMAVFLWLALVSNTAQCLELFHFILLLRYFVSIHQLSMV